MSPTVKEAALEAVRVGWDVSAEWDTSSGTYALHFDYPGPNLRFPHSPYEPDEHTVSQLEAIGARTKIDSNPKAWLWDPESARPEPHTYGSAALLAAVEFGVVPFDALLEVEALLQAGGLVEFAIRRHALRRRDKRYGILFVKVPRDRDLTRLYDAGFQPVPATHELSGSPDLLWLQVLLDPTEAR